MASVIISQHQSRAEKRRRVLHLLQEDPARSNREIGRIAGLSHVAVATMRREFEETYHQSEMETYQPDQNLPPDGKLPSETYHIDAESYHAGPETYHSDGNLPSDRKLAPETYQPCGVGSYQPGKVTTAETYHPDQNLPAETYRPPGGNFADWLATAPIADIAAHIMSWSPVRRGDLMQVLRRARYRKLGSGPDGRAVRATYEDWKYRTTPDQRTAVIELAKAGVGPTEIGRRTGVHPRTAASIIKRGR